MTAMERTEDNLVAWIASWQAAVGIGDDMAMVQPPERGLLVASDMLIESQKPIKYTLDGENYQAGKTLRITMGPRLELVVC